MRRIILTALACNLAICATAFAGSIAGKITYDGNVPKLRPYDMAADPDCAKKHSGGKAKNQSLVLGDGNTLGNIFVQIKNPPAGDHKAPSQAVIIDQNGCIYVPRVVGVMVGQPLKFKNSDGILHNVHGLPKVNREFNIGMPPSLKQKAVSLNKPDGTYEIEAWHEKLPAMTGSATVSGGVARVDLVFRSP